MKARVLTRVNLFIGFLLGMLGFNSCNYLVKYGVVEPMYGTPIDTTVHVMYGVPSPELNAPLMENIVTDNEDEE